MIDFKLIWGFAFRRMDEQTDICDCRVAFATENTAYMSLTLVLNNM